MTARKRGFAAMAPERRREIARMGGAAVRPENRGFSKDRALAVEAGRKGGQASKGTPKRTPAERLGVKGPAQ